MENFNHKSSHAAEDNQINQQLSAAHYVNPAGVEFPVIAYNNVPLVRYSDTGVVLSRYTYDQILDFMKQVMACGFNVNIWVNSYSITEDVLKDYFQIALKIKLPSILNVSGMLPIKGKDENGNTEYVPEISGLERVFRVNSKYASLWGYLLTDEPPYKAWAVPANMIPDGVGNLTLAYNRFLQLGGGKRGFINLAVTMDDTFIGPSTSNGAETCKDRYGNYLKEFYQKFHPSVMSVDIYPLVVENANDSSNKEDHIVIKDLYYWALETIAHFSANYNMPFWLFMLSNQHTTYHTVDGTNELRVGAKYPYPTVGVLRFQAMTALAHGIQGLVFWTYGIAHEKKYNSSGELLEEYYTAPCNKNGNRTDVWFNCRVVINQIKLYGEVLLDARFISARHIYGTYNGRKYSETTEFYGQFGCIKNAEATGNGFVITHLVKDGNINYMAIVSHDCVNTQSITLDIDNNYVCTEYIQTSDGLIGSLINPKLPSEPSKDVTHIVRDLSAGGMILIKY